MLKPNVQTIMTMKTNERLGLFTRVARPWALSDKTPFLFNNQSVPFFQSCFQFCKSFLILTHSVIILDPLKLLNDHFCAIMQIESSFLLDNHFQTSAVTRVNVVNSITTIVFIISTDD